MLSRSVILLSDLFSFNSDSVFGQVATEEDLLKQKYTVDDVVLPLPGCVALLACSVDV